MLIISMITYIFCPILTVQHAPGVVVEAVGAGIHALEHVR